VLGRYWSRQRSHFIGSRADGALMCGVSTLVNDGQLEAVIDSVVPRRRIGDAYQRLAAGGVRGKIVVDVSGED
jgi:NADPH:quinone reductase-like Zn-dependent oxidoreductase